MTSSCDLSASAESLASTQKHSPFPGDFVDQDFFLALNAKIDPLVQLTLKVERGELIAELPMHGARYPAVAPRLSTTGTPPMRRLASHCASGASM